MHTHRWNTLAVAVLAFSGPGRVAAAAQVARVPARIEASQLASIAGTRHVLATADGDVGPADAAAVVRGVELVFAPSADQAAALADRFGLAAADLERVTAWLRSNGFSVDAVSPSRTRVSFSGTVARLSSAFHTSFRRYAVDGVVHTANATELAIPAALAPVVATVRNTGDFRWTPRSVAARRVAPEFTSTITGNHFLAPADFATIYGVAPLHAAGLDGSGQRIAIVGQSELGVGRRGRARRVPRLRLHRERPQPGSDRRAGLRGRPEPRPRHQREATRRTRRRSGRRRTAPAAARPSPTSPSACGTTRPRTACSPPAAVERAPSSRSPAGRSAQASRRTASATCRTWRSPRRRTTTAISRSVHGGDDRMSCVAAAPARCRAPA